jgi:hypothetical protein
MSLRIVDRPKLKKAGHPQQLYSACLGCSNDLWFVIRLNAIRASSEILPKQVLEGLLRQSVNPLNKLEVLLC